MAAFQLVVGRLADVVQQAAAAGQVAVQADLFGHHAGEERHFDRVPQHVLAVAGAEVQPAEQVDRPSRAGRGRRLPARPPRRASGCAARSPSAFRRRSPRSARGWMRPSAISLLSDMPGDLAADRVEAADDHHAGRVVDDHVDAGGLLEGADVAPFAADDPALHFVAGDVDGAGGGLGRVGGGVALHGGEQHLARLLLDRLRPSASRACRMIEPISCVQLLLERVEQPLAWLRPGDRPLSWCSVCRCMSSSLPSSSLRRLASSSRSASLPLVGFDHLLLLAELRRPAGSSGVLPLVERAARARAAPGGSERAAPFPFGLDLRWPAP